MGMASEIGGVAGAAVGILAFVLVIYLITFAAGITMYILQALGLYTIAQRRGIRNPWLAWIPVAQMWILGSISDQYRYVTRGQICNKRKLLLFLLIAMLVVALIFTFMNVAAMVNMVIRGPQIFDGPQLVPQSAVTSAASLPMGLSLAFGGIGWIIGMVLMVFQYICLYDLFASCSPENKTLYMILSILINVTLPIFVFVCRKQDGGMPPRRDTAGTV